MMSSVLTGDVRQTLDYFRRSVDQLFENFYGFPAETGRATTIGTGSQLMFAPAVETAWGDTSLHLRAILPGVQQNDLKVSVQNNQLVIEGERKAPEAFTKNGYTQLTYGKFRTEVALAAGLDLDKLNCRLHDGVLDIQIPIAEQMKARQIHIQSGDQRKSISA
jgi:HSP20 family protein